MDSSGSDTAVPTKLNKKQLTYNAGTIKRASNRILVTGGCGFIGSHLIDRLMQDEHNEVICADNLFSGSKANIRQWLGNPRFEFVRHDVTQPLLVEVDQIYHLACPASPVFYQNNGIKTIKTNVLGTMNMLGLAKRVRARFLLSSTSEVYGDPDEHPQREEYWGHVNPIGIRSCYDEGKRVAESLAFEYHRQNNVDIRVARIFNTYGPRMLENDGRVVSNFIVQALKGEPLTVYGEGDQTRSFCYVSDLVTGLISLMNGNYIGPVNLGNPVEYTIKQLAETVQNMVNPDVAIISKPIPSDDPRKRKPDITKAKQHLNWEPAVPLEEGLTLTIDDFTQRLAQQ
ncbi:UDPglucuronate decarboxylase, putative [Acanthamoeba castellanii str. Neff]|uniref:UDP-glucuronate decarboxylase n=1 Tax=Acanthamoeba castellanii (strain ATCC 30010 / Neff) TaxID=1257118 RepID=L8HDV9_ACACF|nr:UDPglucuronate decarboxylase, putative [Acanthamoeba castellanii str. Neff]ELR23417.1 UDPglucuronate decarboxylase, putative [Acanthamoeba castellanii str. Neff]